MFPNVPPPPAGMPMQGMSPMQPGEEGSQQSVDNIRKVIFMLLDRMEAMLKKNGLTLSDLFAEWQKTKTGE